MKRYRAPTQSPVTSLEIVPEQEGFVRLFLHLPHGKQPSDARAWLKSLPFSYSVETSSSDENQTFIVLKSPNKASEVEAGLEKARCIEEAPAKSSSFNPWVVRSLLGLGGQGLQLASAFMRPSGKVDSSTFIFAASNLTANLINLRYGGQEKDDPHQRAYLQERYHHWLNPDAPMPEVALPKHDTLRSADTFLRRNSVNVGELGLRYLGAAGLAFPPHVGGNNNWDITKGFPKTNPAPLRAFAGIGSIIGKTIALQSTVPDPYNPQPRSSWDIIREKYTFVTGGLIEAVAYGALAFDSWKNTHAQGKFSQNGIVWKGQHSRDWLGAIGSAMFTTGYIVRSWAPYGTRHVDMEPLIQTISADLAQLPAAQQPVQTARIAQDMARHFNRPDLSAAQIYSDLLKATHSFTAPNQVTPHSRILTKELTHTPLQQALSAPQVA